MHYLREKTNHNLTIAEMLDLSTLTASLKKPYSATSAILPHRTKPMSV